MTAKRVESIDYDTLRQQVRLLMLLDGCERAGIAPIRLRRLHIYAYLSNVLAPVWHESALDGQLLKQLGGPFYPTLQHELDHLVGLGLVTIADLAHVEDDDGRWRIEGSLALNHDLADQVLEAISLIPNEISIKSFLLEVAYAVSALTDSEFDQITAEDPTYSDPNVGYENVVAFDKFGKANFSANAARHFVNVLETATDGELLHLFFRHMRRRIGGEH